MGSITPNHEAPSRPAPADPTLEAQALRAVLATNVRGPARCRGRPAAAPRATPREAQAPAERALRALVVGRKNHYGSRSPPAPRSPRFSTRWSVLPGCADWNRRRTFGRPSTLACPSLASSLSPSKAPSPAAPGILGFLSAAGRGEEIQLAPPGRNSSLPDPGSRCSVSVRELSSCF